jgi:hypothetical protein
MKSASLLRRGIFELGAMTIALLLCWLLALSLTWLALARESVREESMLGRNLSPLSLSQINASDIIGRAPMGGTLQSHERGVEIVPGEQGASAGLRLARALDISVFEHMLLRGDSGNRAVHLAIRENADRPLLISEPIYLLPAELQITWSDLKFKYAQSKQPQFDQIAPKSIVELRLYVPPGDPVVLSQVAFAKSAQRHTMPARLDFADGRPESWLLSRQQAYRNNVSSTVQPPAFQYLPSVLKPWLTSIIAAFAALVVLVGMLAFASAPGEVRSMRWIVFPLLFPIAALSVADTIHWWWLIPLCMIGWTLWYQELPERAAGPARRAWYEALLITGLGIGLLLLLKSTRATIDFADMGIYLLWSVVQQWILQTRVYGALRVRFAPAQAAWIAASIFALFHLPNFGLMILSLLAARVWCWHFERHGRWLPIALSHSCLGFATMSWLPPSLLLSGEVSARFLFF